MGSDGGGRSARRHGVSGLFQSLCAGVVGMHAEDDFGRHAGICGNEVNSMHKVRGRTCLNQYESNSCARRV